MPSMGASGPLFMGGGGYITLRGVNSPLPKGLNTPQGQFCPPFPRAEGPPGGLCLPQAWVPPRGSRVAPGVAPPPDKAAGAQRAGAGRGLTG